MASIIKVEHSNLSHICIPGETTIYVSVYMRLDWIRNITQGDICETDLPGDEQPTTGPALSSNMGLILLISTGFIVFVVLIFSLAFYKFAKIRGGRSKAIG